jgi:hypothetical protein
VVRTSRGRWAAERCEAIAAGDDLYDTPFEEVCELLAARGIEVVGRPAA